MQNEFARPLLTVSELLRSVRDTLERRFPLLWVKGELSNLSRAPSGHRYFTLKDRGAQVDCVMYRSRAAALEGELREGMQVEAQVAVSLYPAPVQGEGAGFPIAAALKAASARAECDLLLLVRGGGSIEDLWPFNEESVARAIRSSTIPVLVGVGHESDFTIADFAADRRAPTPTAAAELATPARVELLKNLEACVRCLSREMRRRLQYAMQSLDGCAKRLVHPAEPLRRSQQ